MGITLFLTNTKQYNHLSNTSFKIVPLCNYTLLPTTVRVLESFLEAILWKPFQLFRRILNDASSITIALSVQCLFQSKKQVQFSSSRVRRVCGYYSVVALLYAKLTKIDRCAGELPWKRNQLRVLQFSGRFLLTASLWRLRMARCIYIVSPSGMDLRQTMPGS